jgi:ATP synthase protein I
MPESGSLPPSKLPPSAERMIHNVGTKQERMLRARTQKDSIFASLTMLGTVGWSVAIPTLIGVGLGVWIDRRWPGRLSWTLMLLFAGLALGCAGAWLHIREER